MAKIGRPKKPKAQQKTETIHVKATSEQKKILAAKAAGAGEPLSLWLLKRGLAD